MNKFIIIGAVALAIFLFIQKSKPKPVQTVDPNATEINPNTGMPYNPNALGNSAAVAVNADKFVSLPTPNLPLVKAPVAPVIAPKSNVFTNPITQGYVFDWSSGQVVTNKAGLTPSASVIPLGSTPIDPATGRYYIPTPANAGIYINQPITQDVAAFLNGLNGGQGVSAKDLGGQDTSALWSDY